MLQNGPRGEIEQRQTENYLLVSEITTDEGILKTAPSEKCRYACQDAMGSKVEVARENKILS